jgi:rsbT co-antagonist protein RsbR
MISEHGMSLHSGHERTAEEYQELYRLTSKDLEHIRELRDSFTAHMDDMVAPFYEWLETLPEFQQFFSDVEVLERVKSLQIEYWKLFMEGEVGEHYVEQRRRVGEAHARIGLPLPSYFAAVNMFQELFNRILENQDLGQDQRKATMESFGKLLHLDTAVVVETYNNIIEDTLTAQAKSLMEMSTPVTQIWSGILLLPIVGIIDSKRARDVMNGTLAKIAETQARIFILDISGVGVVDTAVANHLIKITQATRLMGCDCTISGVSPSIAQTIVDLGIDVGKVKTTATMKDALADAFQRVGMEITVTGS